MTSIESEKVDVNGSNQEVFDYLRDMNNFKELLPQHKISNWQSDQDSCSFKVDAGYTIGLKFDESIGNEKIIFQSTDVSPFPFHLHVFLTPNGDKIEAHQECIAKLNPFLKGIIQKPLKALFDYIANKLSERFQS